MKTENMQNKIVFIYLAIVQYNETTTVTWSR